MLDEARPAGEGVEIDSDRALLVALGISENEASRVLGRSRQSLYQAKLAARTDYFKRTDIISLVFAAKIKSPRLKMEAVYAYIARTRKPDILADVRSISASNAEESKLASYRELWFVIPDFSYLSRSHPEALQLLSRLAVRSEAPVRFFVANDQDKALVRGTIEAARQGASGSNSISVDVEPWMGAIPYTIIGEPHGAADCYLFVSGRYMRHEWFGGQKLALLLRSLVKEGLVPTNEQMDSSDADETNPRLISG